ncbi:MAG TPA: peptidase M19 [Hellea balneolensis]|uniref:Peptidase M19 n=1 Tax=Hellea balneolensis TaxID=287478 RepID=A0A7V5U186_9PROT|nr:peptidase M19 [Hellea balneolensis]
MWYFFRRLGRFLMMVLVLGAGYFFLFLPAQFDRNVNVVVPHAPYVISPRARALHDSLRVADMHADTLMWKRDPLKRHKRGHVDVPRLREGGVALQVFSTVSYVPGGQNVKANRMSHDRIGLLDFAQLWPPATWFSIRARALYQAKRLQSAAARSDGTLVVALSAKDMEDALALRALNPDIVIGILSSEGGHPLEGRIDNLDVLYAAGYREIGLQHFFDNRLGGSLHGVGKGGLTPFGREVVKRMLAKHMIIDVAHSSEKVVEDVLDLTDAPIVISHTGVRSLCNHPQRNISDALLKRIADRGGLIGIGYWKQAVCDPTPDGIARTIKAAAEKFGVDHIALGSDFDGTITSYFDTSELAVLTDALLKQGMSESDIRKVMGENEIAFYLANLPQ